MEEGRRGREKGRGYILPRSIGVTCTSDPSLVISLDKKALWKRVKREDLEGACGYVSGKEGGSVRSTPPSLPVCVCSIVLKREGGSDKADKAIIAHTHHGIRRERQGRHTSTRQI